MWPGLKLWPWQLALTTLGGRVPMARAEPAASRARANMPTAIVVLRFLILRSFIVLRGSVVSLQHHRRERFAAHRWRIESLGLGKVVIDDGPERGLVLEGTVDPVAGPNEACVDIV